MYIEDLEIELSNKCNYSCPLCLSQTHTIKKLIALQSKIFLDKLKLYSILAKNSQTLKFCTFAGSLSEPTLHPEFLDIVKYILKTHKNISLTIYTNGSANIQIYKTLSRVFSVSSTVQHRLIFTVCGSSQELHQKYRTNSSLQKIIDIYDICSPYCYTELNWIIFNYNINDYLKNTMIFGNRHLKVFYSIPYNEILKNEYTTQIRLPENKQKLFDNLTFNNDNSCPADNRHFRSLGFDGNLYKCNMQRFFGDKYCFVCNSNNLKLLLTNNITPPAEPSGETYIFKNV